MQFQVAVSVTRFLLIGQIFRHRHVSLDVFPDLIDFLKKLCLKYDWVEGGYQLLKLPDRCVVKDATVTAFNYNSTANEPILVAGSVETQRFLTVQAARTEKKIDLFLLSWTDARHLCYK